jgi:aminopeptidase
MESVMPRPDPAAFADLLAGYCLEVAQQQQILVRSTTLAAPLLLELQRAILQRGAWPLLRTELPEATLGFYRHAQDLHFDLIAPFDLEEAKKVNATLSIQAPANTRALTTVDPGLIARVARARRDVRNETLKRRWATTLWPTESNAQEAGMSLDAFGAFVERALFLDQPDPVASWGGLRAFQDTLIRRLSKATTLRVEAPGTSLELGVKGRTWINSDGRRNMPSGEVFTGPHEASANGHVTFGVPSSPAGVEVANVELELRDGEVVSARAERGQEYLERALATDDGARRLGEVGIGTNFGIDRPVGAILFDEKIGGTLHLALGRSYPESGGRNQSALHWDLILDLRDGGTLWADDDVIQQDGKFVTTD